MASSDVVLLAVADVDLRRSLEFLLGSAGFQASPYPSMVEAFESADARHAVCAIVDDAAVEDWIQARKAFRIFARPIILLVTFFRAMPELPQLKILLKPFLGEPLLDAVRHAVAGGRSG
jgi:hypothetical protein